MESNFIEISRGRFHYRSAGNPTGFPLVMVHGWPESSYCWTEVIPHLEGDFRIICPDLRGLGDSERTLSQEAYLKSELAKDLVQMLDTLSVDEFFLVGHDWGGAVVQEMAVQIPNRIRKLVILNISIIHNLKGNKIAQAQLNKQGNFRSWYQHFQQQTGLPEAMISGNEAVWIKHMIQSFGSKAIPAAAIEEYIRCYAIEHTPATGANYYRTFRQDIKRWGTYLGYKHPMPSMYIYGNKDVVVIPSFLEGIEECFENIQVKEIEAGHFVMEEQPLEVAKYLNDFFG